MSKVYIVLFENKTLHLFSSNVNYSNFEKNTRVFITYDYLPIINVCEWIENNYSHDKIKEVKNESTTRN